MQLSVGDVLGVNHIAPTRADNMLRVIFLTGFVDAINVNLFNFLTGVGNLPVVIVMGRLLWLPLAAGVCDLDVTRPSKEHHHHLDTLG